MFKYLILLISIFIIISCGEEINNTKDNTELDVKTNQIIELNQLKAQQLEIKRYHNSIPLIKRVKSFKSLDKNKVYNGNKITKMNYSGQNSSKILSVCREPGEQGFLFKYMGIMLNQFIGRQFLHLDTREPVEIYNVDDMDAILPFSTNLDDGFYDDEKIYNFGSYFSIDDTILYNLLSLENEDGYKFLEPRKNTNNNSIPGFYYNKNLEIPKMRLTGMEHPALHKENNEFSPNCWNPSHDDFKRTDDISFSDLEDYNGFNYYYNFTNSYNNGLCLIDITNSSGNINVDVDPWGTSNMDYFISPRLNHSFLNTHFPTACLLSNGDISDNCDKSNLYNMYIAENRLRSEQNPNSYNIHFPFNSFLFGRSEKDLDEGWYTPEMEIQYLIAMNFTGLDLITDTNANAIVQSGLLKNNLYKTVIDVLETNSENCDNKYNFNRSISSELCATIPDGEGLEIDLNDLVKLDKSCFNLLLVKTENDLIEYFYEFSQNSSNYTQDEKQCIYKAWTIYSPNIVKFHGDIWNPVLEKSRFESKTSYNGCSKTIVGEDLEGNEIMQDSCKIGYSGYDSRIECSCDILPNSRTCNSTPGISGYDDIPAQCYINPRCNNSTDCVKAGTGFGIECLNTMAPVAVRMSCTSSLNHARDYFNNNEREYDITFNHTTLGEINIDMSPEKLGVNKVYLIGGGMSLLRKVLHFNYYRHISIHNDCEKIGESCEEPIVCVNHEDCNILQKKCPENSNNCNQYNMLDSGIQYGCFKETAESWDGVCSTPLSAVSINARTLNNNFYDPRIGDQDSHLNLWIKYDADYAYLDFDSFEEKDWSSRPSTIYANIDSIIYLVPIMINGNLMIDYHPMLTDSTTISFGEFHLAGGNIGDIGTFIEGTVRNIAIEKVSEQIKKTLAEVNSGSIDTRFNILEKIDTYFDKLTTNTEEIIDDVLKDDQYPSWNEVKTSLNSLDIFNFRQ